MRRLVPLLLLLVGVFGVRHAVATTGSVDAAAGLSPLGCPLLEVTGMACPTCGMGRSLVASANLNVAEAVEHHPFGPPFLLAALGISTVIAAGFGPSLARRTGALLGTRVGRTAALLAGGTYLLVGLLWNHAR